MKLFRKIAACGITCACAFMLFGCAGSEEPASEDSLATYADIDNMDFEYTDCDKDASYDEASATKIALTGDSATVEGEGAQADGSTVTIDAEGTYVVSGELANGQLCVNIADTEKAQIVLANASIHNESGAALFVEQADKCFITLAADSENTLTDGADYALAEGADEPDAVLFSNDDLTINGTGKLTVDAQYKDGIASKDDLTITGGTYDITAAEDGLRGKDSLKILDGTFTVEAGEDALKSSRDDDPTRGFVSIDGGTFALKAGDDAVHGETYLRVTNGKIAVSTCEEGLEAMVVQVDDGTVSINANDDALNAADPSATSETAGADVSEGMPDAPTGMDGAKPEGEPTGTPRELPGGTDTQGEQPPAKPDGDASGGADRPQEPPAREGNDDAASMPMRDSGDKGQMPAEDNGEEQGRDGDLSAAPMPSQGGGEKGSENCKIIINGGTLTLEAKGDAIDSNGSLEINGGTVYVTGPTSGGDGALDYALDASCNGGELVIVGSADMAQDFSASAQPSAFVRATGAAGQEVSVVDPSGTTLLSYTPTAAFETVIVSSSQFVDGQEYSLAIGDAITKFTAATK